MPISKDSKSAALYAVLGAHDQTAVVVDDDHFSRELCKRNLLKAGYNVIDAEDGETGLEAIRKHRPPLVISDWVMPGIDGVELCRQVKDDPDLADTHFIILTAKDETEDLVDALDAGADDFLPKPWNPRELLARARAGLRTAELQRALSARNRELRDLNERFNCDLAVVSNMQKAMLPVEIPQTEIFDFSPYYLPTASGMCGGDYYDLVQLDDRHLGFVIADVSGHGAPAMVTMALIRQNIHIIAPRFNAPHLLLEELNRLLWDHLPTDQFATMLYGIIDVETREMHYASAGHNPPLLYRAEHRDVVGLPHCESFPLKLVTRDVNYFSHTLALRSGDRLVFYTDGIPECFNSKQETYGMERFQKVVEEHATESARQIEDAIVMDVMQFADGHDSEDDLTLAILAVR